ncbi:hypothetical protein J3Q64DRAFT_1695563 [Phycomyces blakesleeanus]|uniref:Uncharacterized protein n=1 Tax=Phycomyces blakesleeanus TaxID=4837 RepID=A0ABR3B9G7_PHYBL
MVLLLSGTQRLSAPPIGNTSQLTGREIPECVSVYWKEERDMLTFGIWIYHAACYLKDVIVQEEERSTREICSGQTENARSIYEKSDEKLMIQAIYFGQATTSIITEYSSTSLFQ